MSESKNNYKIYMHKNKENGKVYIGQTKQNVNHRWDNGNGYVNCVYFYRAIKKYGWDSFEHLILKDNLSKEEADDLEINLISQYQSDNPKYGYNISSGGAGSPVIKYKNIYKYDLLGNFIEKIEDITCLEKSWQPAIRQCCDEKIQYAYGFQWKLYFSNKIEPIKSRSEVHFCTPVYQYDLNGNFVKEYASITIAAKENNIKTSGISKCCRHKQKAYKNYQWSYNYSDNIGSVEQTYVYQFDEVGNFVEKYSSVTEASRLTNICACNISSCICGNSLTAGGYVWKRFQDNYDVSKAIRLKHPKKIEVTLIDDNENEIKRYPSLRSAMLDLELKSTSSILRSCDQNVKTRQGYRFKYT